jgi:hypothetical protein
VYFGLPVKDIESILARQYRGTPLQKVFDIARLQAKWAVVQGEPWGTASWPLRLQNGILWIGVPDASWAQRMAMDKRRIIERAAGYLGYEVELRHRVSVPLPEPPPAPPKLEPVLDDPRVHEALRELPEGAIRQAMENYLSRLAAYQRQRQEDREDL